MTCAQVPSVAISLAPPRGCCGPGSLVLRVRHGSSPDPEVFPNALPEGEYVLPYLSGTGVGSDPIIWQANAMPLLGGYAVSSYIQVQAVTSGGTVQWYAFVRAWNAYTNPIGLLTDIQLRSPTGTLPIVGSAASLYYPIPWGGSPTVEITGISPSSAPALPADPPYAWTAHGVGLTARLDGPATGWPGGLSSGQEIFFGGYQGLNGFEYSGAIGSCNWNISLYGLRRDAGNVRYDPAPTGGHITVQNPNTYAFLQNNGIDGRVLINVAIPFTTGAYGATSAGKTITFIRRGH